MNSWVRDDFRGSSHSLIRRPANIRDRLTSTCNRNMKRLYRLAATGAVRTFAFRRPLPKATALPDSTSRAELPLDPAHRWPDIVDIAMVSAKSGHGAPLGSVFYMAVATGGVYKTWRVELDSGVRFRSHRIDRRRRRRRRPTSCGSARAKRTTCTSSSWGRPVAQIHRRRSGAMLHKSQQHRAHRRHRSARSEHVVYVAAMGPLWSSGGERGLQDHRRRRAWTNARATARTPASPKS